MTKYVRFENQEDLEFVKRLFDNAVRKMYHNPATWVGTGYDEIILRVQDSLQQAQDVEGASVLGVPDKEIRRERADKASKKPAPKKRKRRSKAEIASEKKLALCKKHLKYGAARPPRTDCKGCWKAYKDFHPLEYDKARKKFLRNRKLKAKEA